MTVLKRLGMSESEVDGLLLAWQKESNGAPLSHDNFLAWISKKSDSARPAAGKVKFERVGHQVRMERPKEDPNLHPEVVLYGGEAVSELPFPANTNGRAVAEIDLTAIHENATVLQTLAAKSNRRIMAVLKANAYGHGAVPVAHTLYKCNGIDFFGVATVNEGIELRMSGVGSGARILIWVTHKSEWKACVEYELDICVTSEAMAQELIPWCESMLARGELECPLRAHVLINTGVSRSEPEGLGLQMDPTSGSDNQKEADAIAATIKELDIYESVKFVGIMAHLAPGASEFQALLNRFKKVVDTVRKNGTAISMIHLENSQTLLSGAVDNTWIRTLIEGPNQEYSTVGYCRTGGGLYGQREFTSMQPCITLKSQIRMVHVCKKGCPVGYERAWAPKEDIIIATLAIGFADGYAREFSNTATYGKCGKIAINGQEYPIAGKVCMDMLMVNCGPPSGTGSKIKPGDYGILFGKGGVSLENAAKILGTTQADISCDFTRRIERRYVRPPQPQNGWFVCTSVSDNLHPEVLYGGTSVGAVPYPIEAEVRLKFEVDLAAISHNANELQKLCAKTNRKLMGILKANSYGHGAVPVAHMLMKCNQMDFFGVASINEAIELRMSGIPPSVHILVLGPSDPLQSEWRMFNYYDLDIGVQNSETIDGLINWATEQKRNGDLPRPLRVHVLLNTGMSRVGLQTFFAADDEGDPNQYKEGVQEAARLIKKVADADKGAILFSAVMTHMCDAHKGNPFTQTQFARLKRVVTAARALGVRIPAIHMENSEATLEGLITPDQVRDILRGPNNEFDTVGYCRSGGGMYGQRNYPMIKPACRLMAQVRNVHVTPDDQVIATVACGYADGYSRDFGNEGSTYGKGGSVGIHGVICDIAGKVAMDLLTVKCGSKKSEAGSKVKVGDYAVLFGKGGPALKQAAGLLLTAQSDVTCDLTRRPERTYVNAPMRGIPADLSTGPP